MAIQWFPGHMHKARKAVKEILPNIDLIVEVLDARIPYSSENPMIAEICSGKKRLKVLTKSDLADPALSKEWMDYFNNNDDISSVAVTNQNPNSITELADKFFQYSDKQRNPHKTLNVMIVGIPNVGKSTLINTIAGKPVAKTGNEPAITKGQQRINLRNGIMLFDTPGMLWPKVENELSGYRLATTGAIKDTAISHDDVAFFAADYLLKTYPERLTERYELKTLPSTELEFLEAAGARRGCLGAGGRVDLEKISTLFLNDLRSGKLGALTLETPSMMEQELIQVERQREEKRLKEEERKQRRKKRK